MARWHHQQDVLGAIAWQDRQSLYELTEQGDRDAGVFMVTPPDVRLAKVRQVDAIWTESTARLVSLPALSTLLAERGVSSLHYAQLLHEQEQAGKSLVIVDARS